MGNCQASEAAVVVLQHPGGRIERLYWPTSSSDVMKSNPGHYVALITTTTAAASVAPAQEGDAGSGTTAVGKVTKVRLLRAKDTLMLGQVYRLVTSQEVLKGLRARKQEKIRIEAELMRRQQQQQQPGQPHHHHHHRHHHRHQQAAEEDNSSSSSRHHSAADDGRDAEPIDLEKIAAQAASAADRHRQRAAVAFRARNWRPSLNSINEVNS